MSLVVTTNNGKVFEKPDSGSFHGVLADVVDLGMITTSYQGVSKTQPMVRIVWFLNVNGTDGKALSVAQRYNANLHEKSTLYKHVKMILNAAPPTALDLESLIGQTRQLFILRNTAADGKEYANIQGIAPAQPGVVVPIPADFVRFKNKPPKAPFVPGGAAPAQRQAAPVAAQAAGAFVPQAAAPTQAQGPDIAF
jgi:hypothetical protein